MWHDTNAVFGFQRLAIVDVAHGDQPTCNEDGSIRVVFNGEVYNHRQLRSALAAHGHRFRNESDVEVIPHLYEEHGVAFVDTLDGDFAIAIWDATKKTLILARDRVGVKPLFVHTGDGTVVFASEMKGIFASGYIRPSMDSVAADVTLDGHRMSGGDRVKVMLWTIDNSVGTFSLDRGHAPELRQLWFGSGKHFCLGPALSHLELDAFLDALLANGKPWTIVRRRYRRNVFVPLYQRLDIKLA